MNEISPEFNSTDALLLYSIAYCQRHNEKPTLGRILLTTDAINRSFPMSQQLEDGFSRLIVNGYLESKNEVFTVTEMGLRLFNEITEPRHPKVSVFEQITNLTNRLNISRVKSVSKKLTVTDTQVSEAIQEAHATFSKITEDGNNVMKPRKEKGVS